MRDGRRQRCHWWQISLLIPQSMPVNRDGTFSRKHANIGFWMSYSVLDVVITFTTSPYHPLDSPLSTDVHLLVMAGADVQAKTKLTFLPRRFLCFGYLMSWLCIIIIIRWLFPPKAEWISHWTIVMSTFLLPINICNAHSEYKYFGNRLICELQNGNGPINFQS